MLHIKEEMRIKLEKSAGDRGAQYRKCRGSVRHGLHSLAGSRADHPCKLKNINEFQMKLATPLVCFQSKTSPG